MDNVMGERGFLKLLARTVRLYENIRIYNTASKTFKYELKEKNGMLLLIIQFPTHDKTVTVTYDTKLTDEIESKLEEAEAYLEEKSALTKRYF